MKIVHLADSHLGFSGYNRLDEHGRNRMEERVYEGFDLAVEKIISLRPDAVVHAGDVFHHVRPKIRPLVVFQRGLQRLTDAGIPVIIISGNHDAPKSFSSSSPFLLFEGMKDVHIAQRYAYERFDLDDHAFHCIPFCLEPDEYLQEFGKIERSGRDVLVMHGLVESLRNKRLRTVGEHELKDSLLKRDFDYIALGHFHGQARVAENAWYSGSVEYFNFGEAGDQKGLLSVDLEDGEALSVEVRPKNMIDHPPVDCSGLSTEAIAEVLMELCDPQAVRDKLIRITLRNVSRAAFRRIDQVKLSRLGAEAIYLKVRPEFDDEKEERMERPADRFSLQQEFVDYLSQESREGRIAEAIRKEVAGYGSAVLEKAVAAKNTEVLDAPQ
ncbi:MAG: DNA repair exonuclease [Methanotrichaceae archaeon]|nr:DNA repair exonuclease [Methanotrichaceae archaeon]